ncbi:MAG: hypothetical protein ACYCO9_16895 [Streptosporangiaceae bacterium]
MTGPEGLSAGQRAAAARETARREAQRLARDTGAQTVTRPVLPGGPDIPDVEPLAGAVAARDLENAARRTARDYIARARQAGHDWDQIGTALGLDPGGDQPGITPADAAWAYAAGPPETDAPWRPRSFAWTCSACGRAVADQGPDAGPPPDAEPGHTADCPSLAAKTAAWDAAWAAIDSEWEPGQ